MSGFTRIVDSYRNFMEAKSDPRTSEWLFMSGPGPLVLLLATYLYFCISAGPRFMRDRKPFELNRIIQVYNAIQVVLSIYLVHEGLKGGWTNGYSFKCQPVDYSDNPVALRMANAVWFYFMCKLIELLDTVFFVLRKKTNQVTFLHLYHHTMMPICAWIGTKFLAGGHGTLLGVINSFIHIIMYTYYLVSSLGPEYQKYLWWKRHLTTMQIVQFCIIFVHNFQLFFRTCNYPKGIVTLLTVNAALFIYLFGKFYYNAYIKSRKTIILKENGIKENNNVSNGKAKAH